MTDRSEGDTKKLGGNHILSQFLTLQTSNFTMTQNVLNRVYSISANQLSFNYVLIFELNYFLTHDQGIHSHDST